MWKIKAEKAAKAKAAKTTAKAAKAAKVKTTAKAKISQKPKAANGRAS